MTFPTNAKLRLSSGVTATHLTFGSLPSYRRSGYPKRAPTKSGVGIGVLKSLGGHTASMAVFLCPQHGTSMDGLCRASFDALVSSDQHANLYQSVRPDWRQGDGLKTCSLETLPMRNPTQGASAPRYRYSLVAPSHHHAATIAAESPQKALSVFSGWFDVHSSDVALIRRVPVQEVAHV